MDMTILSNGLNAHESSVQVSRLIHSIFSSMNDSSLTVKHIFTVLIRAFAALGPKIQSDEFEEAKLKHFIIQKIKDIVQTDHADDSLTKIFSKIYTVSSNVDEALHSKLDEYYTKCEAIGKERSILQNLSDLVLEFDGSPIYQSLIQNILTMCKFGN